jgi:hypothetical protein
LDLSIILKQLKTGKIGLDEAKSQIENLQSRYFYLKTLKDYAKFDLYREKRLGIPEVVFCHGKEEDDAIEIMLEVVKEKGRVMATKCPQGLYEKIKKLLPQGYVSQWFEKAKVIIIRKEESRLETLGGRVGIVAAGTSDIPIAEEARITCLESGCEVFASYDVGIAGYHRIFDALDEMLKKDVDVFIVCAGMEGALPSVVKSLVALPVIGVPTSIGYGVGEGGRASLFTMLQSCSPGISVVNIDNGFGAGCVAALIANRCAKYRGRE